MKKISLLALAVATTCSVMAQETNRQQEGGKDFKAIRTPMASKTRFGIEAGVNLATFNDNNFSSTANMSVDTKTSFHAGAFVNIPLGATFRFQPGIMYNGLGSKVGSYPRTGTYYNGTYNQAQTFVNYEQDLHYISVPLMLQLQSKSGIFVEAGPQVGFLITAKEDRMNNTETFNKNEFDKLDVGGSAGIGYLTRIGLGLKANYYFGLANIIDDGGGNNSSNDGPELKNRAIQIGLVYHFGAAK